MRFREQELEGVVAVVAQESHAGLPRCFIYHDVRAWAGSTNPSHFWTSRRRRARARQTALAGHRDRPGSLLSAQQALEQSFEKNSAVKADPSELNAHALGRHNAAHGPVGLDASSGHFKDEYQPRTHRPWIGVADEQTAHPESPYARNLLLTAAVPDHKHALWQGDAFVPALH